VRSVELHHGSIVSRDSLYKNAPEALFELIRVEHIELLPVFIYSKRYSY